MASQADNLGQAPTPAARKPLRPSIFMWLLLAVTVFAMNFRYIGSVDTWHHLKCGEYVWERGWPAEVEPFSCTAQGKHWIQFEWLAQLIIYLTYRAADIAGIILLKSGIFTIAYLILARACVQRGARWYAAVLCVGQAALIGSLRSLVRPEMFSMLLFAVLVLIFETHRRGKKWPLLIVPLLMAIWPNFHGAYAGGLVLLSLTAAGVVVPRMIIWLRGGNGSSLRREPMMLKPWQGGPPISRSSSPAARPVIRLIAEPRRSWMSP